MTKDPQGKIQFTPAEREAAILELMQDGYDRDHAEAAVSRMEHGSFRKTIVDGKEYTAV